MKILTLSDTVCDELLEPVKGGPLHHDIDLIISCGDLPPEYLVSLKFRYDVPLLYVLGNHDLRYETSPPTACRYVDRKIVCYNSINIVGFSGSRWYNGGKNQYTDKEMKRIIGRTRFSMWRCGGPDIIVSHAPPRYINDAEDPCHKGFHSFRKLITRYNPAYFLHGHIHRLFEHDSERITLVNSTQVINSYGFHIFEIHATAKN